IVLDDGTATATAKLLGDALAVLPQLSAGLAVNLVGTAEAGPDARLTVTRAEDIIPIGDPATSAASADASLTATTSSSPDAGVGSALSSAEDVVADPPPTSNVPLLVGLLLALAVVGVVALVLGRRPRARLMAHPAPEPHP